ncbi:hypothetical protein M413DRAFT_114485 [Hebeloma cylindrosporum]|uniref:Uncharacterized protein n=1 Tax=Hebeloma cylindrosporum TaxID=76867 RepID=A0A0C3CLY1_HEBCY|nr:hypothetical protein M413DRAFT_114485 [Hebeloma cylindrosporum h7]
MWQQQEVAVHAERILGSQSSCKFRGRCSFRVTSWTGQAGSQAVFFRSMPCRHSHSYKYESTKDPASFTLKLFRHLQFSLPYNSTKPHILFLGHPNHALFHVCGLSWAMTLSHIHLPSISSVLTSERVFLPGHYRSTRLDMGAAETKSLPNPDFLMVC